MVSLKLESARLVLFFIPFKDVRVGRDHFVHPNAHWERTGRMPNGDETLTVPKYGGVLVGPEQLRQVFNDTDGEVLWLIVGAPEELEFLPYHDLILWGQSCRFSRSDHHG